MGNCQAIDAAALVIQHPSGRIERLYCPVLASEVMRNNPGHYVSLIIPLPLNHNNINSNICCTSDHQKHKEAAEEEEEEEEEGEGEKKTVQFTRVKLLRPTETLSLGHAYRLVTTQEVMKVLRAKKHEKMKRQQQQTQPLQHNKETEKKKQSSSAHEKTEHQQVPRLRQGAQPTSSHVTMGASSKTWRPSLQSITESP